jgi:hypothetical protein
MRSVVGLVLLATTLAGCQLFGPRYCTGIGCESSVTFVLSADLSAEVGYDVEACLDALCDRQTLRVAMTHAGPSVGAFAGRLWLDQMTDDVSLTLPEGTYDGRYEVRLLVRDEAGDIIADVEAETAFERQQPNGPRCEPVCWNARIED